MRAKRLRGVIGLFVVLFAGYVAFAYHRAARHPAPQAVPLQQGWLAPPHVAQVVPEHTVLVPVQALPAQQG